MLCDAAVRTHARSAGMSTLKQSAHARLARRAAPTGARRRAGAARLADASIGELGDFQRGLEARRQAPRRLHAHGAAALRGRGHLARAWLDVQAVQARLLPPARIAGF